MTRPAQEHAVDLNKLNKTFVPFMIPAAASTAVFMIVWPGELGKPVLVLLSDSVVWTTKVLCVVFISLSVAALILVHEVVHLAGWKAAAQIPFREMKIGLNMTSIVPYAHTARRMTAHHYRIGVLAPLVILGIVPYIGGLTSGCIWFAWIGILTLFMSSGDFLVLWLIRKVRPTDEVQDHPTKAGCFVWPK